VEDGGNTWHKEFTGILMISSIMAEIINSTSRSLNLVKKPEQLLRLTRQSVFYIIQRSFTKNKQPDGGSS